MPSTDVATAPSLIKETWTFTVRVVPDGSGAFVASCVEEPSITATEPTEDEAMEKVGDLLVAKIEREHPEWHGEPC